MTSRAVKRVVVAGGLALALGVGVAAEGAAAREADPSRAIVKIYAAAVGRDVTSPWRPGWSLSRTGSGAVIAEGLILTAAHVVDDQTFVLVRLNGTARKAQARVLFVSHVADLALLAVDAAEFLSGVTPLALGELPAVRDAVAAYGFSNGGETLSITEGVVARAEHESYVHSRERLLALQMDAAIAPGSSGGPLVREGRIVGVAMQGFKESAIGCAVPVSLVRQFLSDVVDGRLDGIPDLGFAWQKLESGSLRASLGVPAGETGVLLKSVDASPSGGVLRKGDVLLGVSERAIADDGTVELRPGERTDLAQVTDLLQLGERVTVRYLRDGVVQQSSIDLTRARGEGRLVPRLFDRNGDYVIFGGLAFVSLTRNMLDVANELAPAPLVAQAEREASRPGAGLVLLATVLASDVNAGYEDALWELVRSVDGREVGSLAELVALVERANGGPYVSFGLDDGSLVTDRQRAAATATEVLARYEVGADRSPRLRALSGSGKQAAIVAEGLGPGQPLAADGR